MTTKTFTSLALLAALALAGCGKAPITAMAPTAHGLAAKASRPAPPALRFHGLPSEALKAQPGVAIQAASDAITLGFNNYTDLLAKWNATNDDDAKDMYEAKMVVALDAALTKAINAVKESPEPKARTIADLGVKTRSVEGPLKAKFDVENDINKKRELVQQVFQAIIPGLQQMLAAANS
ncbi:MAG: hypothetical protein JWM80_852 [Cyanobacteria bacterium RYN_339]|nr:hypothetical protein [Cyanobacteria bacterium RYN_339]